MKTQQQTFLEKCYKDNSGRVVLYQTPNLPLIVWIVTTLLGHIFATGELHEALSLIAFGAIFTWAWLELFQGSSYFRRVLGLIVLVAAVANRLN